MSNIIDDLVEIDHFLYRLYAMASDNARRKSKENDLSNEEFLKLKESKICDKIEKIVNWFKEESDLRKCRNCYGKGYLHLVNIDECRDHISQLDNRIEESLDGLSMFFEKKHSDFAVVCEECNGSGKASYND